MFNEETVSKIQYFQFLMLKEVKRICEKNKISYFLCCGTLLGCVRNSGPIPWDDDLDVGMLRNDYNRFIEAASNEIDSYTFFLQTWHTDEHYALPHCKIRLKNSHYIETVSKDSGCEDGINIDVLPFDVVPNNKLLQIFFGMRLFYIMNVLKIKRNWSFIRESRVNALEIIICTLISYMHSEDWFIERYEELCTKYNNDLCSYYLSEVAGLDFFRFINRKEYYLELTNGNYMGEEFPIPKYFDYVLRGSYGNNYLTPPPEKCRKGQPGVEKVIFP